ncbi:YsnF/AvaK domain-containing protein [Facklamia lactis]|nr:YsnF/AvaK domain-containing protein [Facklamia lactis]MBG9980516.1 YsnF/AvaK domain-containing protein [Facklamia lactis]
MKEGMIFMVQRYVYGVYPTFAEAEAQADAIVNAGVPSSAVSLVSNDSSHTSRFDSIHAIEVEDNRNWFEKLFGLGEDPDYHGDTVDFSEYETSLRDGQVLVVVDRDYEGQLLDLNGRNVNYNDVERNDYTATGATYNNEREDLDLRDRNFDDTENIRLHEERINIDKQRRDAGEVEITKEVISETQTVEVPVEREEIHIKHKTPTDETADADAFTEEEIVVPISEEEVTVSKDTVVTDEVEVSKTAHTDYETVSEETRREELEIHDQGDLTKERLTDEDLLDENDLDRR